MKYPEDIHASPQQGAGAGDKVILIGYRGTGKTTVARLLATELGCDWVDADAYLEAKYGRTISDIFQQEGEPAFREMEAVVLPELCAGPARIVATGGGVILRKSNRDLLGRTGTIIWLTADAETIWSRLQNDPATADSRPPLTGRGDLDEVRETLATREPFYRQRAHYTVNTAGLSPKEVVETIRRHLQAH